MMPKLSLAICTHNPRTDYLDRTLRSLQKQTIPLDQWELLLIDNASTNGVVQTMDLAWHPNAHVVKEARIGLTMARLRAIEETSTPYLVFADDDNELAPDYLATMIRLAQLHPTLGVIGAGRIVPDFEETPAPELKPYVPMLALRSERRSAMVQRSHGRGDTLGLWHDGPPRSGHAIPQQPLEGSLETRLGPYR
ncbi:MAG: glycosyltransferase family 2 protein [Flavobacteriales bacterium]|nr:glycosyltransferase family 2 protein [Flavobacteriales bacterium]